MPIRLNLLAEAQAAEEMRRRDPVKRALWVAGFLVAVLLVYSGTLQAKIMSRKSDLNRAESEWKSLEKGYNETSAQARKANELTTKLNSLDRISTNRFLWAPPLNALQQTIVENVQVGRLRGEHQYLMTEAVAARTNNNRVIPGKAATVTEKIAMVIEARDYGSTADQNFNKFESAINNFPWFKERLRKATLSNFSPPTADPQNPGRTYVLFTLECHFPEVTRE